MFLQSVIIPLLFFCLNPFDVDAKGCEKYGFIISDIEHVKQSWPHPNAVVVTFENTDVPLCLPYGKGRVDPTKHCWGVICAGLHLPSHLWTERYVLRVIKQCLTFPIETQPEYLEHMKENDVVFQVAGNLEISSKVIILVDPKRKAHGLLQKLQGRVREDETGCPGKMSTAYGIPYFSTDTLRSAKTFRKFKLIHLDDLEDAVTLAGKVRENNTTICFLKKPVSDWMCDIDYSRFQTWKCEDAVEKSNANSFHILPEDRNWFKYGLMTLVEDVKSEDEVEGLYIVAFWLNEVRTMNEYRHYGWDNAVVSNNTEEIESVTMHVEL